MNLRLNSLKQHLLILSIFLLTCCSSPEQPPNPTAILQSKTWTSFGFILNGQEFNQFILKDRYLDTVPNSIIKEGDSMYTYLVYILTFHDNNKMNFVIKRNRYIRCSTCNDFVPYDSIVSNTAKYYFAKNTFVVLADSTGWNPVYYETDYINDHTVRFNKCVKMSGSNLTRNRTFNSIPLLNNQDYYLDILMRSDP